MKRYKKIILFCLGLVLILGISYGSYYVFHYVLYDEYKESLTSYSYEEGMDFKGLTDADPSVEGMILGAESEYLKLYTNTKTAEVAVYDKRNGVITYTNPQAADEDELASNINKSMLKSQLIIDFYNKKKAIGNYNSYDYSTSLGQFEIEAIDNGFRYVYMIGDLSSDTGIVPIFITKERLDSFLQLLDEKSFNYVSKRYSNSRSKDGFLELNEAAKTGASTLRKMNEYLELAGYSLDDYEQDMQAAGVEFELPVSFEIPLEYRLLEDGLNVSIPTSAIKEHGGGILYRVQLLRYFGAGNDTEDGYLLVPNGSGSIIHFNNGKTKAQDYMQYVYGYDPVAAQYLELETSENVRLPIYGISRGESGILASIETGESLASINASVAGKINSYNYAYPMFEMRVIETHITTDKDGNMTEIIVANKDLHNLNMTVRYSFLDKDYADYSGMANYYREHLISEGILNPTNDQETKVGESIPFYMDIIGGVARTGFILGKQYNEIFPMTTFKQAAEITSELKDENVTNLVMNYQGWFNGGYYHDIPSKIKVIRKLGGKSGLSNLTKSIETLGGRLYGEVAFQKVPFMSDDFKYMVESSKYYASGSVVAYGQVNPVTYYKSSSMGFIETKYNMISPKYLPRYVNKFSNKITNYNLTGITLKDLGDVLHSDRKRIEVISREDAEDIVIDQLQTLADTNKKIMVSGGNLYALAYSDDIINAPINHNTFPIVDEEIPFYQMVLHGSINYTGNAINLLDVSSNQDVLLRLIEYGASPHYTFSYKSSSEMKYTGLNMLHSTDFAVWKEEAVRVYNEVNEVLKHVNGVAMLKHEVVFPGVKKISYENGVIIYVNTTGEAVSIDHVTIESKGYEVEGIGR